MKMQMLNKLAGRPAIITQHIIAVRIHRGGYCACDSTETLTDPA
jgi:hypothetical protein